MKPEWITAIASCIAATSVLFVAVQAYIAVKQLKSSHDHLRADHERSRRENAINVVRQWTETLNKSLPAARKFVQQLSKADCKKLLDRESFEVNGKYKSLLKHALHDVIDDEKELDPIGDKIMLSEKHLSELLVLVVHHLNTLEVALLSWMNGVADRDIIEHEFKYLIRFDDGHYILENLREVMAGKAKYPAIDSFVNHLIEEHKKNEPQPKERIA